MTITSKNKVKVKLANGEIKILKFVFNSDEVDPKNGFISINSPLAQAIIGGEVNQKRKYQVNGKELEIEILEVVE